MVEHWGVRDYLKWIGCFVIFGLCCLNAKERPFLGVSDGSRVQIEGAGMSLEPPVGWQKRGAYKVDAENYRFPWFQMKQGLLQFAMVDEKVTFESASDGAKAHLKKSRLTQKGEMTVLRAERPLLNESLVRVNFTNGIVRYYFLNAEGKVGFMHFVGAAPDVVEKVIVDSAKF